MKKTEENNVCWRRSKHGWYKKIKQNFSYKIWKKNTVRDTQL